MKTKINKTDLFLIILIILNIIDFLEIIPTTLDFTKKIISWALLTIILIKASPSKTFFGTRNKKTDIALITAYFLMIIKNLTSYAGVIISKNTIIKPIMLFLLENHSIIEETAFKIGIIILIIITIKITMKDEFKKRSIMGILHEEGKPDKSIKNNIIRLTMTFMVIMSFFLLVFNLMMEWLAIAIDSIIVMIAIFFYLIMRINKRMKAKKLIEKIGDVGSKFYEEFIENFKYKEKLMLGITGILVLHMLTDTGNFIIPYLTGIKDQLYFGLLGAGHDSVWQVLKQDLMMKEPGFNTIISLTIFLANIVAALLIFTSPAIIWYQLSKKRKPKLPRNLTVIFTTTIIPFITTPLFRIKSLAGKNLIGVDVQTQSLYNHIKPEISFTIMTIALIISIIFIEHKSTRTIMNKTWIITSTALLGIYSWLYFKDIIIYYQEIIINTIMAEQIIIPAAFIIFGAITTTFYLGSNILFWYEIKKAMKRKE